MSTKSILRNIDIKSRTMGYAIVSSLEGSKNKKSKDVVLQHNCEEIKGKRIKQIFDSNEMTGYVQINLTDMINNVGEDKVNNILFSFLCHLNKDAECFLKKNSINYAKSIKNGIAVTYLVFKYYKHDYVLVGYYTLAPKLIMIARKSLSKNMRKKLSKYTEFDENLNRFALFAPLIVQLANNYNNGYDNLITCDELLKLACDKVKALQDKTDGCVVYLECEDTDEQTQFYFDNGFKCFGFRMLDSEEIALMNVNYLVRMIKYY